MQLCWIGLQIEAENTGAVVLGTVNKSSQIGDSELLIKQRSEAVFPWIEG
jgi:hypothetical protein